MVPEVGVRDVLVCAAVACAFVDASLLVGIHVFDDGEPAEASADPRVVDVVAFVVAFRLAWLLSNVVAVGLYGLPHVRTPHVCLLVVRSPRSGLGSVS